MGTFKHGKLPDFLICGFQKCATSALAVNLNKHPKICVSRTKHPNSKVSEGKEFNFFASQNVSRNTTSEGISWYKSHFNYEDDMVYGESSPNYSFYADDVIANCLRFGLGDSQTKFILSIRNPIYRAYSAYNHFLQEPDVFKDTESKRELSFIDNVMATEVWCKFSYSQVIDKYFNAFGRDRVLVVSQERLQNSHRSEYRKIFRFLGLPNHTIKNEVVHSRSKERPMRSKEKSFLIGYFLREVRTLQALLSDPLEEWEEFTT